MDPNCLKSKVKQGAATCRTFPPQSPDLKSAEHLWNDPKRDSQSAKSCRKDAKENAVIKATFIKGQEINVNLKNLINKSNESCEQWSLCHRDNTLLL